jgi:hypothetical protein
VPRVLPVTCAGVDHVGVGLEGIHGVPWPTSVCSMHAWEEGGTSVCSMAAWEEGGGGEELALQHSHQPHVLTSVTSELRNKQVGYNVLHIHR